MNNEVQLIAGLLTHNVERFAVDIGASDGHTDSNTLALLQEGWTGLLLECDGEKLPRLRATHAEHPHAHICERRITPENVLATLREYQAPTAFGLLSLDIDGYDYYVLEQLLTAYRPAVICTEINEKIPPPVRFTVRYSDQYRWPGGHFYGCSLQQLAGLAEQHQYVLAALEYHNALLVPRESGIAGCSVDDAYRSGYRERPNRHQLFPWNSDMEYLQTLPPEQVVAELRRLFQPYSGQFWCTL